MKKSNLFSSNHPDAKFQPAQPSACLPLKAHMVELDKFSMCSKIFSFCCHWQYESQKYYLYFAIGKVIEYLIREKIRTKYEFTVGDTR